MNLKDSFNWLVRQDPYTFGVRKRGTEPLNDPSFISVNGMYKGNFKIQISGDKDYRDNLEDKTVIKDYFCADLQDDELKVLGLAHLGSMYLRMHGNFSDELEAENIINRLMRKKRDEVLKEERFRGY